MHRGHEIDPVRVLINGATMLGHPTGIGRYACSIADGLHRADVSVGVFDGARIVAWPAFASRLADSGAASRLHRLRRISQGLPGRRDLAHWWLGRMLRRQASAAPWDVFFEPNYVPPAFTGPTVAAVHDLSLLRLPQHHPADRVAWFRGRMANAFRDCARLVAVSEFTKEELLHFMPGIDPGKIDVAHNGVDLDRFKPASRDAIQAFRKRCGLPGRFALAVGTLEPRKNLAGLLRAFGRWPAARRQETPLVIAGGKGWRESSFRSELQPLVDDGSVRLLGYVPYDDLPVLLSAAACFAFVSFYEGFGLPLLEAAACGVPIVASDIPPFREIMADCCRYADPQDSESILAAIDETLAKESVTRSIGDRARRRAQQFPWSASADKTLDSLLLACGKPLPGTRRLAA